VLNAISFQKNKNPPEVVGFFIDGLKKDSPLSPHSPDILTNQSILSGCRLPVAGCLRNYPCDMKCSLSGLNMSYIVK